MAEPEKINKINPYASGTIVIHQYFWKISGHNRTMRDWAKEL